MAKKSAFQKVTRPRSKRPAEAGSPAQNALDTLPGNISQTKDLLSIEEALGSQYLKNNLPEEFTDLVDPADSIDDILNIVSHSAKASAMDELSEKLGCAKKVSQKNTYQKKQRELLRHVTSNDSSKLIPLSQDAHFIRDSVLKQMVDFSFGDEPDIYVSPLTLGFSFSKDVLQSLAKTYTKMTYAILVSALKKNGSTEILKDCLGEFDDASPKFKQFLGHNLIRNPGPALMVVYEDMSCAECQNSDYCREIKTAYISRKHFAALSLNRESPEYKFNLKALVNAEIDLANSDPASPAYGLWGDHLEHMNKTLYNVAANLVKLTMSSVVETLINSKGKAQFIECLSDSVRKPSDKGWLKNIKIDKINTAVSLMYNPQDCLGCENDSYCKTVNQLHEKFQILDDYKKLNYSPNK